MASVVDFFDFICNTLDIRFFAGLACSETSLFHNNMSSEFMHYIPATNAQIAVGMVNGATLAGMKSAVLIGSSKLRGIDFTFNIDNEIPLLVLAVGKDQIVLKNNIYNIVMLDDFEVSLNRIINYINTRNKPGILLIKTEVLI